MNNKLGFIIVCVFLCTFVACSNQVKESEILEVNFKFSDFLGDNGSVSFCMFGPHTTRESFKKEYGMSYDEYKKLEDRMLDSVGAYTGDSVFTIEGVPVYLIPSFSEETGCVERVSISFMDDGRSGAKWGELNAAFKETFENFDRTGSLIISDDEKTTIDFEYVKIGAGDEASDEYRIGYLFLSYE